MALGLLHMVQFLLFFIAFGSILADQINDQSKPAFVFSWLEDKDTYVAGDTATIKIKILGNFDPKSYNFTFKPTISVNEKSGNSSYVSGLSLNFGDDLNSWTISFVPILVGTFNVLITDDPFGVLDSSLHFFVNPGPMHSTVSTVSWMDYMNEFTAGTRAMALILPKDAFGNTIPSTTTELNSYIFNVSESFANNSAANDLSVTCLGWSDHGYLRIEFIASSAGDLLLHVQRHNQTLRGSPLPFKVHPGPIDVSKCVAKWKYGSNISQYESEMEIFIYQLDFYGNLFSELYSFDAEIVEKSTNLSIPVPDLNFVTISRGIQLLSFRAVEPGEFLLTIYDSRHNTSIANMPYEFAVSIGSCDGTNSIINGSGLNDSIAGQEARFSVYLKDSYQYPCPVELRMVQVQIARVIDSFMVPPKIYPLEDLNGSLSLPHFTLNTMSHSDVAPSPLVVHNNSSLGTKRVVAYAYGVLYTPERSGAHDILVLCGNIPMNRGVSLRKDVKAGDVNMSLSGVVRYVPKVKKLVKNEVTIQLIDSFFNPVLSQQLKLKLEIGSMNNSVFLTWKFVDHKNGSYTGQYQVNDTGTYELCATFDGTKFSPCPFGVNVYSSDYFPKAHDDSISLWEDESVAFNALENDYFAGENATVIVFSNPLSGSVLQSGLHFRYTPYKGFYGNDTFSYTIRDLNGNTATASVHISVLSIPPQLLSLSTSLKASEDVMCPKFGGFHGLEVIYPDLMENISVILRANCGTVSLSPMMMQFWEPIWSEFAASRDGEDAKALTLAGHVEDINMFLQSIQYLGDENFYGNDTLKVTARNKNGATDLNISIFVEPVNDPPFIFTPEHIILDENEGAGSLIYEKKRNKVELTIGDPDLVHFPGNKSEFLVIFSMEVTSGILEAILPVELINTTELKLKDSYRWQPLQTFVTISDHLVVKAKGLRFQATVDDCNNIVKQLRYHCLAVKPQIIEFDFVGSSQKGVLKQFHNILPAVVELDHSGVSATEYAAILTIKMNDMGNYGCFPDCSENISKPLTAEVNVNLIKGKPLNSRTAHALGFLIILEFLGLLSLGGLFLFYTCRCAISLIHDRRNSAKKDAGLGIQTSSKRMENIEEEKTAAGGGCPCLPLPGDNFRQRSWHKSRLGASIDDGYQSWPARAKNVHSLSVERTQSAKM